MTDEASIDGGCDDQRDVLDLDDPRAVLDLVVETRSTDPERAHRAACEARALARAAQRTDLEAESLYHLASIAHDRGELEDSFALASEAVALTGGVGGTTDPADPSTFVLAWSMHLLGIIYYRTGNFSAALQHCGRALELYRTASPRRDDEGRILHTIAAVHQAVGDHRSAEATYLDALAVNETVGRHDVDAMVLGNLARLRVRRGEYDAAIDVGRSAAELARSSAVHLEGSINADLAEAFAAVGDLAEARRRIDIAAERWWQGDDERGRDRRDLTLRVATARVALRAGEPEEAVAALAPGLDGCDRIADRQLELELHELLADAYARLERFDRALEHRERHFALHRDVFTDAAQLRLRTLQIAHAQESTRQSAEITRLRTSALSESFARAHTDPDAYHLEAFERLAALAEFRGGNTTAHTAEVGDLSAEIAHAIGQQPHWCERLRLAARLHDIGKVAVADAVLLKQGPLTLEDYDEVKQHTILGRRLLSGVSTPLFALAAEIAWSHHEWWDGTGYPNALSGESIPLAGRIVAIADVFDALATRRVYKRQWNVEESVRFIVSGAGAQFDPALIRAFVSVMAARHPDLDLPR